MAAMDYSTGLKGLDVVIRGLIPGDNVVWQVDSLDDYRPFVDPYVAGAVQRGRKLIYFRFATHAPLVQPGSPAEVHELDPAKGFESFITRIHETIESSGRGTTYLFDCLSELAGHWHSDQMLTNFFLLTCPYLYDVEAIAYFPLLRESHALDTVTRIQETAQVIMDVYSHKGALYVQPIKVQQRYSPTMHMLHVQRDDQFEPVTESATIVEILSASRSLKFPGASIRRGIWNSTFVKAEEALHAIETSRSPEDRAEEVARSQDLLDDIVKMSISRDARVANLVEQYLGVEDLVQIGRRIIGTGLIGGKAVGMLLARAVLKKADPRLNQALEAHDSFYIGSDVFYTFLVNNGVWWMRQKQKDPESFLKEADRARQRILIGTFPKDIQERFEWMLDYFGQSPIIVRSSSLLEDNFGNSFSGKYESVFCANQGPRHKRLDDFLSAVRTIYASTMSEKALSYRAQRGILDKDEQMALLVQRVSGAMYGRYYFPQLAGVGFSYNPYVWNEYIDPEAGMLRLVFGLGTRAVDRADDDYTRVVALNAPTRRPEADFQEVKQYAQRRVDVIDLEANQLVSVDFPALAAAANSLPLEMFASRDEELARLAADRNMWDVFPWVLTFDRLLTDTPFVKDMSDMLAILQKAYDYPVDVEFTANFFRSGEYKINVLQCRPFQVKGGGVIADVPADTPKESTILESHGAVIGQSRIVAVDRIIYVVPEVYGQMKLSDRYSVARLIGLASHADGPVKPRTIALLGPGRWGTTTPWLGVPVSFSEINTISILCEIVAMREDLIPDVSLGTHFFNDLVESDILYMALFPTKEGNFLNGSLLAGLRNKLVDLVPEAAQWASAVRVIDAADLPAGKYLKLHANTIKQHVLVSIGDGQ
jgi:pyruvate, water dikinase